MEEIAQHRFERRKARMDARTRERPPALPVLVRTVDERRKGFPDAGEHVPKTPKAP